jgi:hypothetical protein
LYVGEEAVDACCGFHGDPNKNGFVNSIAEDLNNNGVGVDYEIEDTVGVSVTKEEIQKERGGTSERH